MMRDEDYSKEASEREFLEHVIRRYSEKKGADYDETRAILEKVGVVEHIRTYDSPWVSHRQPWREERIDRMLALKGASLSPAAA